MKRKRSSRGGGGGGRSRGGSSDRRRHSRRGIRRSHFDSSSESSDGGGGGGGGFADHDQGFERYQRKTHERELGSIQPINSFGPTPGGGGGAAGGGGGSSGSIVDKASARDLLRADVNPMEIDSSVTFDSIGGGKVSAACTGTGTVPRLWARGSGGGSAKQLDRLLLLLLLLLVSCHRHLLVSHAGRAQHPTVVLPASRESFNVLCIHRAPPLPLSCFFRSTCECSRRW